MKFLKEACGIAWRIAVCWALMVVVVVFVGSSVKLAATILEFVGIK